MHLSGICTLTMMFFFPAACRGTRARLAPEASEVVEQADLFRLVCAALPKTMSEDPSLLAGAIRAGLENTDTPTVLDIVVTRDPAKMLPAADNRTLTVKKGARPV